MAELTNLESKLGEVLGLAMAAQGATEKVQKLDEVEGDLKKTLEKLRSHFGIETLLLEGGGKINGSFLASDLIDEVSVLVAPVADGSVGTPTLFDMSSVRGPARPLTLMSVEERRGDIVWLRYKRKRSAR